jgi:ATP-dependent RNA helicase HrpA
MEDISGKIAKCMLRDRDRLTREYQRVNSSQHDALQKNIETALARKQSKIDALPGLEFPEILPVSARREEIATAIQNSQVVIVCGDTGSGKTTQIPKICLGLGRGIDGFIGHTQPRRIAARTIASRIAEELKSELGQAVGYKIRHSDKTGADTYIKLMTDGILLAELQQDRLLSAYDTLIIDEAHERSLNIDFILGYLRNILPQRPDLKIIITSATIDVNRFSEHFFNAPVVEVSGRTYPVDVWYRPIDEDNEADDETERENAILSAINELNAVERGDVLIFLEGEREIHETSKFLEKQNLANTDVLPLYARLNSSRQSKIFRPHKRRHIVLSTNVAETSLTIPGIRFVIDAGYARISRYSHRSKVQRLPVEKISRASAEQRKGRCGRVADGICVRLYSEIDFEQRQEFTDPEIMRTNLASVILQMKALRMGDIEHFPFIDKPDKRFIKDGLRLLTEISAINAKGHLTKSGKWIARLPIDPRMGRMLIAANDWHCLSEMLIIVSALSIQSPKERPQEAQEKADKTHAEFEDDHSDFLWYVNFWNFYRKQAKKLSKGQLRKMCGQKFVSYLRMLEWQEIHRQLSRLTADMNLSRNSQAAEYQNIHCALLSGLLSHVAVKTDTNEYLGARNIKLHIFPGSGQFSKTPKWMVAAELAETTRLYARVVAKIDSQWLLNVGKHLLQRNYSEPYWDAKAQQVSGYEKVMLFGLTVVARNRINFGPVDPEEARHIFIRHALVYEELNSKAEFYKHNHQVIEEIKQLEKKSRRIDILDDEAIYQFYDSRVPEGIYATAQFEKWRKQKEQSDHEYLYMDSAEIMLHQADAVTELSYPDNLAINHIQLPLSYQFEPGHESDGISIDIPLHVLNQIDEHHLQQLVPGMLKEKIEVLLRSLPKRIRRQLVPIPETVKECMQHIDTDASSITRNLSEYFFRRKGIEIKDEDWKQTELPEHLKMNIRVLDQDSNVLSSGRCLHQLKSDLTTHMEESLTQLPNIQDSEESFTQWEFDDLPEVVETEVNELTIKAYPALVDNHDSVLIQHFDTEKKASQYMHYGLLRLYSLVLSKDLKYLKKNLPKLDKIKLYYAALGSVDEMVESILYAVLEQLFLPDGKMARTKAEFDTSIKQGVPKLIETGNELCGLVTDILKRHHEITITMKASMQPSSLRAFADIKEQLSMLIYDGFAEETALVYLKSMPRYLDAIQKRLEKLSYSPEKDASKLAQLKPLWDEWMQLIEKNSATDNISEELDEFHWLLEEFRVSLFAQELKTAMPVSQARLLKQLKNIRNN